MWTVGDVTDVLDRVWRAESGGMLGVLTRRLGDLDRAEEALQDALGQALAHWPDEGVPDNPAGWLVTAAWRKAVDRLRREATGRDKLATLANPLPREPTGDDRLALIFACCHPDLPEPAQVALTLNAVTGLTAEQIAAGFLVPTATMAQRLVRAKRQLREARVRFEPPDPADYPTRLPAVLSTLYLIFNEGYLASSRETPQRRELAIEALDLARQLADLLPAEPEVAGLAALLELHEARAATRFDGWGRLVLLEDQDRHRWDRPMIQSAVVRLGRAMARGQPGPYQLQAGIAAQHALAPSYPRTNWTLIRALYDQLHALTGSPVVLLSRAVATRYAVDPATALAEVDGLGDRLVGYRLWHATRAELLRALGRDDEAAEATRRALALATNPAERELLSRRLRTG
ncbi:MAG: RNA polymerase subunit sigma-24 [Micromonosporaceae bacterium]|nr:RNA polymerase subunit sigma-24 [Micromonosporaceae bacterium]